jgi:phospholipase A2
MDAVVFFTDWVEFSPYEIGMAKYGTFMTPDLFGSKFFMGTAVKRYEENPLHFLMGRKTQNIPGTSSWHLLKR